MKKAIVKIITVLLIMLICFNVSVFALPQSDLTETDEQPISEVNGNFQKVLENEAYELYFLDETAEIALVCRENGYVWYSNPQNNENNNSKEKSQLVVYYYENRDLNAFDSFEHCVSLEDKFSWEINNNTLAVSYNIGDDSFSADALPTVISKQRMEKDILSKLTAAERETVLNRFSLYEKDKLDKNALKTIRLNFPSIDKHDLYIRSRMPDYIAEEIYELFKKAGYTEEDLQRDCDENNIENTYQAKPGFYIELEYTLADDGFKVTVNTDKIKYEEAFKPTRIEVLPYFGAGVSEEAYMIVPDGSGAVIEFDNGKYNSNPYWKQLFADDNSLIKEEVSANSQPSVLPIFAISKEKSGFLATIDTGYEIAGITANVVAKNNNYNYIYSFFDLFSADNVSLSSNEQDKFILTSEKICASPINISYHFLNGQHTYTDYALKYREYLIKNGALNSKKKNNSAIALDFLGAVEVQKRFLGIPYKTMKSLTTYKQAYEVIEKLEVQNADINFLDSLKGGRVQEKADNLRLLKILGNKKESAKLNELEGKLSVSYYAQYANSVKKSDSALTLSKSKSKLYSYDFISRYVSSNNALSVISVSNFDELADKVTKSIKSNKIEAVNLLDLGYHLNSDFNTKKESGRYEARISTQKYLEKISETASVSVNTGSIFSLPYIDKIKDIPVSSSGYLIEDYSIPFYQIAISGYVPYSVSSLNTADNSREQFLKAIELGAQLQYTWIYELPDNIVSDATEYYKYLYTNSYEQAKEYYEAYSPVFEKISGVSISCHTMISDTLSKTAFENGTTIYVNYSNNIAEIDGLQIEANNFIFVE